MNIPDYLDLDTIRRDVVNLCRSVAGKDLAHWPLYVVWAREAPGVADGDALMGFTARSLDLITKPSPWRGRGPAMLLNESTIFPHAAMHANGYTLPPKPAAQAFTATCHEIALHELSHILESDVARETSPTPERIEAVAAMYCRASSGVVTDAELMEGSTVPMHGPEFIRLALHVTHRANRRRAICFESVAMTENYGLSPAWEYAQALAGEPARMIDATFAEIRSTTTPPAFMDLWRHDNKEIQ